MLRKSLLVLLLMQTCLAIAAGEVGKSTQKTNETTNEKSATLVSWKNLTLDVLDFKAALQVVPKKDQQEFRRDLRRITSLLDSVQVQRSLAVEARSSGLDQDPVVQRELQHAQERILSRRQLEAFEASLKVPDLSAAAVERYEINKASYMVPESVRASHILVGNEKYSDEAAKARALAVFEKARSGANFTELVAEYSDDTSAKGNHGDLGFFTRGKMVKEFEEAAFGLKNPDDISAPVKTRFGYHIIKLHELRPSRAQAFGDVRDRIVAELKAKWIADRRAEYLSGIRNDKTLKLNQPAIDALQLR